MTTALTPAEALVLCKGVHTAPEAMKATLVHLIAQGVIRFEKTRGLMGLGKTSTRLRIAGEPSPGSPAFIPDILAVVRAVEARSGTLDALARALRKRYGPGFRRLTQRDVVAALVQRGLLVDRSLRLFGLTLWCRVRRNKAGQAERERIEQDLVKARRVPKLIKKDRLAGMALATGIGALFVLLPELRPFYGEIATALRQQPAETAGVTTESGKMVFDADFSGLDSLEAALSGMVVRAASAAGGDDAGDGAGTGA
jgi:hypothetical protein